MARTARRRSGSSGRTADPPRSWPPPTSSTDRPLLPGGVLRRQQPRRRRRAPVAGHAVRQVGPRGAHDEGTAFLDQSVGRVRLSRSCRKFLRSSSRRRPAQRPVCSCPARPQNDASRKVRVISAPICVDVICFNVPQVRRRISSPCRWLPHAAGGNGAAACFNLFDTGRLTSHLLATTQWFACCRERSWSAWPVGRCAQSVRVVVHAQISAACRSDPCAVDAPGDRAHHVHR